MDLYVCHIRYVSVFLAVWIVDVTSVKTTQEKQVGFGVWSKDTTSGHT